ncbi:hypothetical protein LBMAG42_14330 [Deltaproteobacteria bacterium]|nr:hypothetical protein LBMAG42_14330 [Deltaproteobacteria bacterium]
MLVLFLLGCDVELRGQVADPGGAPIAGASLVATEGTCSAVTDAGGSFTTRCVRADYNFVVTHPSHAAGALHVDATAALPPPAAAVSLVPWPSAPGLYLEPDYTPFARVDLVRRVAPSEQRYCLPEGAILPVTSVHPHVFDVHATDWRVFAVDAEGCALRVAVDPGGRYWSPRTPRIEAASVAELAPGRVRLTFEVPPGRYVAVPWFEGFLVPKNPTADTWEAWAFEASAG